MAEPNGPIQEDGPKKPEPVEQGQNWSQQQAADAFLKRLEPDAADDPRPSTEASVEEAADDDEAVEEMAVEESKPEPEAEEAEADEEAPEEEAAEPEQEAEPSYVEDDALAVVRVNGEDYEMPVRELKRLAGQEKALGQRSQELATLRKETDAQGAKFAASLDQRMNWVQNQLSQYQNVDWSQAQKDVPEAEYAYHRNLAESLNSEMQFLQKTAADFMEEARQEGFRRAKERAKEDLLEIKTQIPEWDDTLYSNLRQHAMDYGVSEEEVLQRTDPVFWRMAYDSYQYNNARQLVKTKKKAVARKVIKSKSTPIPANPGEAKISKSMRKLRKAAESRDRIGSQRAAADAFYARLTAGEED